MCKQQKQTLLKNLQNMIVLYYSNIRPLVQLRETPWEKFLSTSEIEIFALVNVLL